MRGLNFFKRAKRRPKNDGERGPSSSSSSSSPSRPPLAEAAPQLETHASQLKLGKDLNCTFPRNGSKVPLDKDARKRGEVKYEFYLAAKGSDTRKQFKSGPKSKDTDKSQAKKSPLVFQVRNLAPIPLPPPGPEVEKQLQSGCSKSDKLCTKCTINSPGNVHETANGNSVRGEADCQSQSLRLNVPVKPESKAKSVPLKSTTNCSECPMDKNGFECCMYQGSNSRSKATLKKPSSPFTANIPVQGKGCSSCPYFRKDLKCCKEMTSYRKSQLKQTLKTMPFACQAKQLSKQNTCKYARRKALESIPLSPLCGTNEDIPKSPLSRMASEAQVPLPVISRMSSSLASGSCDSAGCPLKLDSKCPLSQCTRRKNVSSTHELDEGGQRVASSGSELSAPSSNCSLMRSQSAVRKELDKEGEGEEEEKKKLLLLDFTENFYTGDRVNSPSLTDYYPTDSILLLEFDSTPRHEELVSLVSQCITDFKDLEAVELNLPLRCHTIVEIINAMIENGNHLKSVLVASSGFDDDNYARSSRFSPLFVPFMVRLS
ncbi:hypothetical protein HDE_11744 [Halotydeus destructor]|nr:hypothetical protein HDE_11744 [Halotydeus destructor]